jgi:hypothetical protein
MFLCIRKLLKKYLSGLVFTTVSLPRLLSWKIVNPRDKLFKNHVVNKKSLDTELTMDRVEILTKPVEDIMSFPILYSGFLLLIKW